MTAFVNGIDVQAADLTPIVGNINDLYANRINDGFCTVYATPATIPGASTFAVITPTLSAGSGQGISLSSGLFTLAPGIWDARAFVRITRAVTAGDEVQ